MRSLSFKYDAKSGRALKAVSFFVNNGERIAILGHNGSGKSTLAKILAGLIDNYEGECIINENINVGIVFQDPENQIVASIVEDDAAFAPENQGLLPDEIQSRVDEALKRVKLSHKKSSHVNALSGGEKQRLSLAGVLAAKIDCLILDEPDSMLDPEGRRDLEKILCELHQSGMAIIQISHKFESLKDFQRVIILSEGVIKWQGSAEDFTSHSKELGFNSDYYKLPSKKFISHSNINEFAIKNLSFNYEAGANALHDISANILKGSWLSIIGKTGSGKSTLLQHLNGLYKVQLGEIYFNGAAIPDKGEELYNLRQKVGLVFQHPEKQLFNPTVYEELAFAPSNAGLRDKDLENAIFYGLECVGLDKNFLTRNPLALSGGERRLIAIASVLAARPECIALDEPLAGLDNSFTLKILNMLCKLRDEGKTIITITHDIRMAVKFSDKILLLSSGKLAAFGSPSEIQELITKEFS
mgnify:CR=1 FL=1